MFLSILCGGCVLPLVLHRVIRVMRHKKLPLRLTRCLYKIILKHFFAKKNINYETPIKVTLHLPVSFLKICLFICACSIVILIYSYSSSFELSERHNYNL